MLGALEAEGNRNGCERLYTGYIYRAYARGGGNGILS